MRKKLLLAALTMIWATPLYAAHPLVTDDTGTQGRNRFLLEVNGEISNDKQISQGVSMNSKDGKAASAISYGLSESIDLVAGLPIQWSRLKVDGSLMSDTKGVGDLSLEVKYRFFENSDTGLSFALKPGVSLPTGNEVKGFGNGAVSGSIVLISTYEGKLGALHGNIGYTRNAYGLEQDRTDLGTSIWQASMAAELNVTSRLRSIADIGIETNAEKGSGINPAFLIGGLIYGISDNLDIDLGIRRGLNRAEADLAGMAGMAMKF
jgi:hypothetical protein